MAKIAGKYEIVESHKFNELLEKGGVPADKAKIANDITTVLEITVDGKKVTLTSDKNLGSHVSELILGGESEEKFPNGTVKSTAKLDGNVIKVESKKEDGTPSGTRTYTFSDTGLEIIYNAEDVTAKRIYKRL